MKKITNCLQMLVLILLITSCSKDDSEATIEYVLDTSIIPPRAGAISPEKGQYEEGQTLKITATPATGYSFEKWEGDISGTENPIDLVMDSEKEITAVFKADILGKWDVQETSSTGCRISSMVFNSDGTFIIVRNEGNIEGEYEINSGTITLMDQGTISNMEISNGILFYRILLSRYCTGGGKAIKDGGYDGEDCFSFLECNDDTIWSSLTGEEIEFLTFRNDLRGVMFEKRLFNEAEKCGISVTTNETDEVNIVENSTSKLVFEQQTEVGTILITFELREDGILEASYKYPNDTYYKYFEQSSSEELNSYIELRACNKNPLTFVVEGETYNYCTGEEVPYEVNIAMYEGEDLVHSKDYSGVGIEEFQFEQISDAEKITLVISLPKYDPENADAGIGNSAWLHLKIIENGETDTVLFDEGLPYVVICTDVRSQISVMYDRVELTTIAEWEE